MKHVFKKILTAVIILPILCTSFTACDKKKTTTVVTDAEKLVSKINITLPTLDLLDIDKMLTGTADYDMYFLSGNSFGSNSEFRFNKNTTDRKLVFTNASLVANITNLQQLKDVVNNATSVSRGADTTYNLEQGFANLQTPFFSFKTDKGKLVLMKIESYTFPETDKKIAIINEQ